MKRLKKFLRKLLNLKTKNSVNKAVSPFRKPYTQVEQVLNSLGISWYGKYVFQNRESMLLIQQKYSELCEKATELLLEDEPFPGIFVQIPTSYIIEYVHDTEALQFFKDNDFVDVEGNVDIAKFMQFKNKGRR